MGFDDFVFHIWTLEEYCGVLGGIGGPLGPIGGGKPLLLLINSPWGGRVASIRHGKAIYYPVERQQFSDKYDFQVRIATQNRNGEVA